MIYLNWYTWCYQIDSVDLINLIHLIKSNSFVLDEMKLLLDLINLICHIWYENKISTLNLIKLIHLISSNWYTLSNKIDSLVLINLIHLIISNSFALGEMKLVLLKLVIWYIWSNRIYLLNLKKKRFKLIHLFFLIWYTNQISTLNHIELMPLILSGSYT